MCAAPLNVGDALDRDALGRDALGRREDLVDLSSHTVLILGAISGIGRVPARRFAAAGSTVAVGCRSLEALSELAEEGFGTISIGATDRASVAAARDATLARSPELDTVVTM